LGKRRRIDAKSSKSKSGIVVVLAICAIAILFTFVLIITNTEAIRLDPALRGTSEYWRYIRLLTILGAQGWLMLMVVPLAVVLGIQGGIRKSKRKRLTYKATQGIAYLRETFDDLNPATVSLLMDLRIDYKKDINATLLRMYHKGSIDFEDGQINLADEAHCTEPCEKELFEILKTGSISHQRVYQWGENRKAEAVNKGLLAPGKHSKGFRVFRNCCGGCCLSIFLYIAVSVVFGILLFTGLPGEMSPERSAVIIQTLDRMDAATQRMVDPEDAIISILDQLLLQDSFFTLAELEVVNQELRGFAVVFMVWLLIFYITPYLILRALAHEVSSEGLERTAEGHRRTEEVDALKRFIRDFGDFSQAEKEHVSLWEDFLVFAIVLEENKSIVRNISRLSKNGIRDMELVSAANSQYEASELGL